MKSKKKKATLHYPVINSIQVQQGDKSFSTRDQDIPFGKGQFWIPVSAPAGWVLDNTELS